MSVFKPHEEQVLDLLTTGVLTHAQIQSIKGEGTLCSYEYSGCGYFLTVSHPCLPSERIVCSSPLVLGNAQSIASGFLIFIEQGQLTIECHSLGEPEVPENYRELNVIVSAA